MVYRDFGVVVDTFLDDFSMAAKGSGELTSCRQTNTDDCCPGPCLNKPKPKPKPKSAQAVGARTRLALRREVERAIRMATK